MIRHMGVGFAVAFVILHVRTHTCHHSIVVQQYNNRGFGGRNSKNKDIQVQRRFGCRQCDTICRFRSRNNRLMDTAVDSVLNKDQEI